MFKNKKIAIIIMVALYVAAAAFMVVAMATQDGTFSAMFILALAAAIVLTVLTFKKPKEKTATAAPVMAVDERKLSVERDFYSKVVGVTFGNDDGSSRQEILSKCKVGQNVVLRPVEVEGHPEAMGVFTTDCKQLGHLPAETAEEIHGKYLNNLKKVTISDLTGGTNKKLTRGCNLHIIIYKETVGEL